MGKCLKQWVVLRIQAKKFLFILKIKKKKKKKRQSGLFKVNENEIIPIKTSLTFGTHSPKQSWRLSSYFKATCMLQDWDSYSR